MVLTKMKFFDFCENNGNKYDRIFWRDFKNRNCTQARENEKLLESLAEKENLFSESSTFIYGRPQEMKFTISGRSYLTFRGRHYYFDECMRTESNETISVNSVTFEKKGIIAETFSSGIGFFYNSDSELWLSVLEVH